MAEWKPNLLKIPGAQFHIGQEVEYLAIEDLGNGTGEASWHRAQILGIEYCLEHAYHYKVLDFDWDLVFDGVAEQEIRIPGNLATRKTKNKK